MNIETESAHHADWTGREDIPEYKWANPRANGSHFDPLHPPIHFHLYHHDVNLTTNIEDCIYTVNTVEFCDK